MAATGADHIQEVVERAILAFPIPSGALLLAAVSGGQDSVCLMHSLCATVPRTGARVAVAHVNHGLRGKASAEDAAAVAAIAAQNGLDCIQLEADVLGYAGQHRLGIEEAARNLRYRALSTVAERKGAWAVATGHTLDDLAETLLINIVRGTGPLGLSGIPAEQSYSQVRLGPAPGPFLQQHASDGFVLRVVRPLLTLSRRETAEYCDEHRLPYRTDTSNAEPGFLRNRIRHHLLPLLRSYNPSIVMSLARLAQLTADDEAELGRATEAAWRERLESQPAQIGFEWPTWLAASSAVQRRLLRQMCAQLRGGEVWSFQSLESARLLLAGRPSRRRLSLGGGLQLFTSRSGFRVELRSANGESLAPGP